MDVRRGVVAIVPCNDLDASEAFYNRLGLRRSPEVVANDPHPDYRILQDAQGAQVHLTETVPGWVTPERNPFGVYVYTEEIDALAAAFSPDIIEHGKRAEHKPWGMYEFSLSDPNGVLVRVGWPSRLLRGNDPAESVK